MIKPVPEEKKFYPDYLSEILAIIFLTLGAVFVLAMLFPPLIGREINFISAYQPKPEWYFLWLYQMVRYFPGEMAFVGAVAVPMLAAALLLYLPFIDSGSGRARKAATAIFMLLLGGFLVLTLIPAFS